MTPHGLPPFVRRVAQVAYVMNAALRGCEGPWRVLMVKGRRTTLVGFYSAGGLLWPDGRLPADNDNGWGTAA